MNKSPTPSMLLGPLAEQALTVSEAARLLDLSPWHVSRLWQHGVLAGLRLTRGPILLERRAVEALADAREATRRAQMAASLAAGTRQQDTREVGANAQ